MTNWLYHLKVAPIILDFKIAHKVDEHYMQRKLIFQLSVSLFFISPLLLEDSSRATAMQEKRVASTLPDLSGLAWIEGDRFLAVHDSKNPDEKERPRVSFVWLPESPDGIRWQSLEVDWRSPLGVSNDLESIARIPSTEQFLLIESGEKSFAGQQCKRIFLAELENTRLKILSVTNLPAVKNIEGATVARLGKRLVFIFAERADHRPSTEIQWAELQLAPFGLGSLGRARFTPVGFTGKNWRPVSAIESDRQGRLFVATAYDTNDDNGPFRSVVWHIGQVKLDTGRRSTVVLKAAPERLAILDGLKVESLALREAAGRLELFAGTDDENYGATIRPIPLSR
jgi:hypothetical protein